MLAELPFLGRKINLISKCDIRYEGVLYSIDPKESTIALSKVRSFGTEDRITGRGFVAAKEEIYEYIIFRASDVKDLKLGDSDHLMGLQDPAIIQAVGPKNQRHQQAGGQQQPSGDRPRSGGRPARRSSGRQQNQNGNQQQGNQQQHNQQHQNQNTQQMGRRSRYGSSRSRTGPGGPGGRRSARSQQYGNQRGNQSMVGQPGQQYNQADQRQRRQSPRQRMHVMRGGSRAGQQQQQQHDGGRQGPMSRFRRQLTGRRDSRREPLKFDGDFDFEKSNQEFAELDHKLDKLTLADDGACDPTLVIKDDTAPAGDGHDPAGATDPSVPIDSTTPATPMPAVPAYNKERSFFDTLTCRQNVKPDWRKERRINAETFGIAY